MNLKNNTSEILGIFKYNRRLENDEYYRKYIIIIEQYGKNAIANI